MVKKAIILLTCIIGFAVLTGCSGMCRGGPDDCYGAADCWYAQHNCTSC